MKKSAPNKDGRTPRSVWSAPGLPALLQRPRLPAPPKCGSKLHAPSAGATYQVLLSGAKRLECVRLAGAFSPRATTSTTTHASKSESKLHALQTLARPLLPLPETHLAFPLFSYAHSQNQKGTS